MGNEQTSIFHRRQAHECGGKLDKIDLDENTLADQDVQIVIGNIVMTVCKLFYII